MPTTAENHDSDGAKSEHKMKEQWTAIEIQYALFGWLEKRGRTLILPNFTPRKWHECDLFSITNALYFHEIEVKVSRADFRADFDKESKHRILADKAASVWANLIPRTFCYACPHGLLSTEDMPEYAGLIWVARKRQNDWFGYDIEIVKKPPSLSSQKMTAEQVFKITNNLWWRFANTWKKMAASKIEEYVERGV